MQIVNRLKKIQEMCFLQESGVLDTLFLSIWGTVGYITENGNSPGVRKKPYMRKCPRSNGVSRTLEFALAASNPMIAKTRSANANFILQRSIAFFVTHNFLVTHEFDWNLFFIW